jgi:hypothetical protein
LSDKRKLYACYGIIIESVAVQLGIERNKTRFKRELRGRLLDLFKTEHPVEIRLFCEKNGISGLTTNQMDKPLLSLYIRFILMTLSTEFGIFAEAPNEKGTKDLDLQTYLKQYYDK